MQICLVKSAFSAATDHLSTGIFFKKKIDKVFEISIRDNYSVYKVFVMHSMEYFYIIFVSHYLFLFLCYLIIFLAMYLDVN